ncbi:hypothetical protein ACIA5D_14465 [Actinoplanes sp. NPDC051513]|uniref:hypothetical protein n=1 Tax=Actinoplanes sp. NPDC051513 TaxID=3363908 RepID=UPI0037907670
MTTPFSVHVDRDDLATQDIAAALGRPAANGDTADRPGASGTGHHGAHDSRQAARGRSERDHARLGAGKSRSYAFRRS